MHSLSIHIKHTAHTHTLSYDTGSIVPINRERRFFLFLLYSTLFSGAHFTHFKLNISVNEIIEFFKFHLRSKAIVQHLHYTQARAYIHARTHTHTILYSAHRICMKFSFLKIVIILISSRNRWKVKLKWPSEGECERTTRYMCVATLNSYGTIYCGYYKIAVGQFIAPKHRECIQRAVININKTK